MDEIVKDFLIESNENLDRLDQELVKLESEPSSKELLASIFRTIHTIKGSCGFLGFAHLEKVAHAGESLLSLLRDGKLALTEQVTSGLLAMVDAVRGMLGEIQASEHDGENDYPELRDQLKLLQGENAKVVSPSPTPSTEPQTPAPVAPSADAGASLRIPHCAVSAASPQVSQIRILEVEPAPQIPAPQEELAAPSSVATAPSHRPVAGKIGGILVERGSVKAEDLATALHEQEIGDQRRVGEILVALGVCTREDVLAAQQVLESRGRESGVETVRVGVNLLDKLMNLVGELVLARNQLLQFSNTTQDAGFHAVSQRMNLIATELQEDVMKTRMQPIGNIWNKFPRTVRDLAHSCGKEVRLEMVGQDTELDRTIIEAIKDPLTHLVRNSMDHGIEAPEARKRAGKDATGVLTLRAFHEGGQVNIEIGDDGAGLNADRIRRKAVERGLTSSEQAARMPDRDIFNLIFLPGFSTAEKITNVSGRGVGMDVVKTNVEKIGGTVDVQSTAGKGTTVRVKIPLTLAIIPALVVRCGGERFAIPQISLTELVRLESGKGIETVHGAPVYRLRGQLLPLVYLSQTLNARKGQKDGTEVKDLTLENGTETELQNVNIVVLQAEGQPFGLVVDDILDTEEIVVKPLGKQLKGISAYSGATIMGDGRIALILDVLGLAQRAQVIAEERDSARDDQHIETSKAESRDEHALLLAENGLEGRVAIPLSLVARLEEFPRTVIERAGTQEVMQYRGQIIPLVRLSEIIPATSDAEMLANANSIQVVVYTEGKRTVGLIVDRIVDIVEEHAAVESLAPRAGVVGSFVTQRHVTDLLDVPAIVRSAVPGLLDACEIEAGRT
jgi:two-component system, chemotaxis family, sensor kinase CheA